jgi:hypothetical protein
VPEAEARQRLREATRRYWSHDILGDWIVALFIGSRVVMWRSRRTLWSFPVPITAFIGSIRPSPSGCSLVGRFTSLPLEPLALLFLLLSFGVVSLLSGADFLFVGIPALLFALWLVGRLFIKLAPPDEDRLLIEACLRRAVVTPAA